LQKPGAESQKIPSTKRRTPRIGTLRKRGMGKEEKREEIRADGGRHQIRRKQFGETGFRNRKRIGHGNESQGT